MNELSYNLHSKNSTHPTNRQKELIHQLMWLIYLHKKLHHSTNALTYYLLLTHKASKRFHFQDIPKIVFIELISLNCLGFQVHFQFILIHLDFIQNLNNKVHKFLAKMSLILYLLYENYLFQTYSIKSELGYVKELNFQLNDLANC